LLASHADSLMGANMYALGNINFSNGLGVIVGELPPDEINCQDQTLDAKRGAALDEAETAFSPLETAIFAAA
jgi:hypothetical protein